MRKTALAVIACGAALALTGSAYGKGMRLLAVCGPSACAKAGEGSELADWTSWSTSFTSPSRYYVVKVAFPGGNGLVGARAYWLPGSGWFALSEWVNSCSFEDCWHKLGPASEAQLRRSSDGLEPFAPRLAAVIVGGKRVASPDAYLPLLGRLHWSVLPPGKLRLTRITMRPVRAMPWLPGPATLGYEADHRVLVKGDGHFRVPRDLAARLFDGPAIARSGDSALYAGLGVAVLAALAALALANHKRKETR
jgi:hypothetical protein